MRIYFDENFSPSLIEGLRRIQEARRRDDIEVCSVKEEFGKGTADEGWIPQVAIRHGVIITQDMNINRVKAQWALCQANKVGLFFMKPPKAGWNYWDIVRLTFKWWPEISKHSREDIRPFAYVIEKSAKKLQAL